MKPLRILYMDIAYFDHNTPLSLASPRSVPTPSRLHVLIFMIFIRNNSLLSLICFYIEERIFIHCILITLPLPHLPTLTTPYPFSFSEKQTQNPPNKNTKIETKIYKQKTDKMSKQNVMKPKVYKNTTEFDFCWSVVLGMGPILKFWLTYPVRRHWRKQSFPFAGGLIHRQFLVGDGCLCPLPQLSVGTPDFNPYRLWVCCHNSL